MAGGWFGRMWRPGDPVRRLCLAAGFSIYYIRILFTEFVFLKRGVSWSEVFTIAFWLFFIVLLLGIEGGGNRAVMGAAGDVGGILFVVGSWMNSYCRVRAACLEAAIRQSRTALYRRAVPVFAASQLSGRFALVFGAVPDFGGVGNGGHSTLLMLAGFVFVNIPVLDSQLRDHYGGDFDEHARRTRKLIPFIY